MNSDLLQTIKKQVAKEELYSCWGEFYVNSSFTELDAFINEVAKRYATEVAKASLKKASGSITDESNIVL